MLKRSNLEQSEFSYLFPFYLIVTKDNIIESFGISIEHLFPKMKKGDDFLNTWIIEELNIDISSSNLVGKLVGKQLIITKNSKHPIQFKGQFHSLDENEKYIFLGSPWITEFEHSIEKEIRDYNPMINDSISQFIDTMRNTKNANIELKELLQKVNQHKKIEKELEKALQATKAASDSKEAFISNMSHEIRTPLNGIIGMIRQLDKEDLSLKQQSYVDSAYKAAKHLLSMINTILDLSKIKAGELKLDSKDFSLKQEIEDVKKILEGQAAEKKLDLFMELDDEIFPALKGDPIRIRQILINIAGNSLKFTKTGHVKICTCILEGTDKEQKIQFKIEDTGIGIDPKYLKNIFTKFLQEDSTSSRRHSGTGLGMAICKELVDLMKGQIEIETKKGVGTTIKIILTFPKGNIEKIEKKEEKINLEYVLNKRILMVEDNEMNRYVALNTLLPYTTNIIETDNGESAVELLKNETFDLVLMDLQMPIMGGIEATKIIRDNLKNNVPIIALTANAFKSEVEKCIQAGMNAYVTKPFEEKQLIKTIEKVLKKQLEISLNPPITKLYSLDTLKEMSRGDHRFVISMLQLFVQNMPKSIESFKNAYDVKDFANLSKLAHKIKPSIHNLNIESVFEDIRFIEKYEQSKGKIDEFNERYIHLVETLQDLIDVIQTNEIVEK